MNGINSKAYFCVNKVIQVSGCLVELNIRLLKCRPTSETEASSAKTHKNWDWFHDDHWKELLGLLNGVFEMEKTKPHKSKSEPEFQVMTGKTIRMAYIICNSYRMKRTALMMNGNSLGLNYEELPFLQRKIILTVSKLKTIRISRYFKTATSIKVEPTNFDSPRISLGDETQLAQNYIPQIIINSASEEKWQTQAEKRILRKIVHEGNDFKTTASIKAEPTNFDASRTSPVDETQLAENYTPQIIINSVSEENCQTQAEKRILRRIGNGELGSSEKLRKFGRQRSKIKPYDIRQRKDSILANNDSAITQNEAMEIDKPMCLPSQSSISTPSCQPKVSTTTRLAGLTLEKIDELFSQHKKGLSDICREREYCRRHQEFYNGGMRKRLNLGYQVHIVDLSDSQINHAISLIKKMFINNELKMLDYILKVMLPEFLIKIFMQVMGTTYEEAEQQMSEWSSLESPISQRSLSFNYS